MTRKLISSGSPFEKVGGYSRAIVDGEWIFVSGTTGSDPETGVMPESVEEQTRNCFRTIEAALAQAGADFSHVVRAQYFVTSREDAEKAFPVCGEFLGEYRPAAGIYVISGLYRENMKVEIEVTARKPQG